MTLRKEYLRMKILDAPKRWREEHDMLGRTRGSHPCVVAAVLAIIHLSAISGQLSPGACVNYSAAKYLRNNSICLNNHFDVTHRGHCDFRCNLRDGDNTIVVVAEGSRCNSSSVTVVIQGLHLNVSLNLINEMFATCPFYKVGSFNVRSSQAEPVPIQWSLPGNAYCNPIFVIPWCM